MDGWTMAICAGLSLCNISTNFGVVIGAIIIIQRSPISDIFLVVLCDVITVFNNKVNAIKKTDVKR